MEGLEDVERATIRFVAQALAELVDVAAAQFARMELAGSAQEVGDRANYLGEDLTRLALDRIGAPRVPDGRLFGQTDYKLASYQFLPGLAVRQALFVDSKAEKNALNNARVQVTQTSLEVRQLRRDGQPIVAAGTVPKVWESEVGAFLTTTVFVKYHYADDANHLRLRRVTVIGLPNGFLQDRYNPTPDDRIWNIGPNAPARGEKFRTRVNFTLLGEKAAWRVQRLTPGEVWRFTEA